MLAILLLRARWSAVSSRCFVASSEPLVSVLLPALDAEATLELALSSVARQTSRDFECVVVDNGSRDRTPELAREFARKDGRFCLVPVPERGIVRALSAGLEACRGRYVARMDADDVMHKRRLELQARALDR